MRVCVRKRRDVHSLSLREMCVLVEVQKYRSTEVQKYRSTEVQKYRTTEVQKYRSTELQNYRTTELLFERGSTRIKQTDADERHSNRVTRIL